MSDKIRKALNYNFHKYRLIFWYDEGGEMKDSFSSYNELGIEKVEIENNEFFLRYKLQKLNPEQKFLVYSTERRPADSSNWLLDLNLSGFVFASDKASLFLQNLDLDEKFRPFVHEHLDFFRNEKERQKPLKAIIIPEKENEDSLSMAMLSILAGRSREKRETLKSFTEILLSVFLNSFLDNDGSVWKSIKKYNLDSFFWRKVKDELEYSNVSDDPAELLGYILQNALDFQLKENTSQTQRIIFALVDEWRNNLNYSERFKELLTRQEEELNIKHTLQTNVPLDILISVDLYKEADKQVLYKIIEELKAGHLDYLTALHYLEKRRETFWYKHGGILKLRNHYLTMYYFLKFMELRKRIDLVFDSVESGWRKYTEELYKLDEFYRKFHSAYQESGSPGEMLEYLEKLEREYTEGYMFPLANSWQKVLDEEPAMESLEYCRMDNFFGRYVTPYLDQDKYLFVIISDGMRYELGAELSEKLTAKNRFQVALEALKAPVPSYTQLGMASLLPHLKLEIAGDGNTVLADGKSTQGWAAREKIVQCYLDEKYKGKKTRFYGAREFFEMSLSAQEEAIKGIDLIYLHSPGVDAVGENVKTEKALFPAADKEINFIMDLCRRILNLNRTHIILTADHGFLYRYKLVPEIDWIKIEQGVNERKRDYRFIVAGKSVQLNDKNDTYEASFGNLGIKKIIVDREYIKEHPKLLVGGVWCILDIEYLHEDDPHHSPWIIDTLKPIQISNVDFDVYREQRKKFSKEEWIDLIIHSLGFNPEELGERNKMYQLVRLISYCENNYNLIELGPKGTGKSHVFSEFSPHGILVSGGEVTLAKLFVNNSSGKLGLLGYWDVVAFDEFAGKGKKADKTLIDVMKNYMANHSFSRGTDQITADASMVFVGNTSKSVSYLLKQVTLFDDLPLLYQDSAFLDRIHYYIPGWEVNIIRNEMFSSEFGFIVDYLAQILKLLRFQDYSDMYRDWFELDTSLSTRDKTGINKTFSGLMKIIYPDKEISKAEAEELLIFAMEGRKRVKLELYKLDSTYDPVFFRYKDLQTGEVKEVLTHEERKYPNYFRKFSDDAMPSEDRKRKVVVKIKPKHENDTTIKSEKPETKHISIQENETGVSYYRLFADYLKGAHRIEVQDPYIRKIFQIRNLLEFIQVIISVKEEGEEVTLHLVTAAGDIRQNEIEPHFRDIADQLVNVDIQFTYDFNEGIHDRHIKTDTGWNIIPGRGLDIYQRWERGFLGLEQYSPEARLTCAFDVSYFRDTPTADS